MTKRTEHKLLQLNDVLLSTSQSPAMLEPELAHKSNICFLDALKIKNNRRGLCLDKDTGNAPTTVTTTVYSNVTLCLTLRRESQRTDSENKQAGIHY